MAPPALTSNDFYLSGRLCRRYSPSRPTALIVYWGHICVATHSPDAVATGCRQHHIQELSRLGVRDGGGQLALNELQLGRNPSLAFSVFGHCAFCGECASAPPLHKPTNFPEQTEVVNFVKILQLAGLSTMGTRALSIGQPGDLLLHNFDLKTRHISLTCARPWPIVWIEGVESVRAAHLATGIKSIRFSRNVNATSNSVASSQESKFTIIRL